MKIVKYASNLIYRNHWGGGETQVYEIENYRAVFCLFTGSCFGFYRKEDLNIDSLKTGWFWCNGQYTTQDINKTSKALDSFWDSFREDMDDCIDRCLDKVKNPETHIEWYEKIPDLDDTNYYFRRNKRCFTSDNSEDNRRKIESNLHFVKWFDGYWEDAIIKGFITSSLL